MKYTIEKEDIGYVIVHTEIQGNTTINTAYIRQTLDEALQTLRELFEPEKEAETVYPRVLLFDEDLKPAGSRPMNEPEMEEYARSPKHFRWATTDSPNQG